MSAVTTLKTVWINLASDTTQFQSFSLMSSLQVTTEQPGEVRQYAGGRLRIVRKAGLRRAISCSLPECSRDQIAFLEANVGQVMCFRDDRGRKIWATYLVAPVSENAFNINGNVTLALNEVTHTDVV
jgi:hypothetical protein